MKLPVPVKGYVPTKAHDDDAGYDLIAKDLTIVYPGQPEVVDLGISMAIPKGYVGILSHRSSLAFKKDMIISLGEIDSGFTGVIKAKVFNLGSEVEAVSKGERIAQIFLVKKVDFEPVLVETLEDTVRGDNGFGSSGV